MERQPKYKVKEPETKVAAECGCGGDEPAIPESSVDIWLVFSYLLSTAAVGVPGALEGMARGKPFLCVGFSSHLTVYTARLTCFPHYHQADTTFNSILRQVSSRYWPYAFLSGRPLL